MTGSLPCWNQDCELVSQLPIKKPFDPTLIYIYYITDFYVFSVADGAFYMTLLCHSLLIKFTKSWRFI